MGIYVFNLLGLYGLLISVVVAITSVWIGWANGLIVSANQGLRTDTLLPGRSSRQRQEF